MARGLSTFKQRDVERALKAAKATGAGAVTIRRDGSIVIDLEPAPRGVERDAWGVPIDAVSPRKPIVL